MMMIRSRSPRTGATVMKKGGPLARPAPGPRLAPGSGPLAPGRGQQPDAAQKQEAGCRQRHRAGGELIGSDVVMLKFDWVV